LTLLARAFSDAVYPSPLFFLPGSGMIRLVPLLPAKVISKGEPDALIVLLTRRVFLKLHGLTVSFSSFFFDAQVPVSDLRAAMFRLRRPGSPLCFFFQIHFSAPLSRGREQLRRDSATMSAPRSIPIFLFNGVPPSFLPIHSPRPCPNFLISLLMCLHPLPCSSPFFSLPQHLSPPLPAVSNNALGYPVVLVEVLLLSFVDF